MSNPHNPSGKQFDTAFLTAIADKMKALNGYFVIDEAYLDYGMAYDVEMAPHILRMRTLSKAFGIAGLRLGVLIVLLKRYSVFKNRTSISIKCIYAKYCDLYF